ncbi:glycosyltransferase family 2 protein [Winogradskyella ouciana]|uniref:glycosyltransferase family 2 protein n=1 Tax=Winogradskyella ouciana TaxID=2608631 RepID=UPI003D26ECF2
MKLSVIILNYNVCYFLELCLKSVEAAIKDLEAEVIVVDNNSPDDSCEMVKRLFPSVKLIENKENFGFSKGNNIGVAEAEGEYVCILNPDTVVAEDTFVNILEFADSKPQLGIIGCQLIDGRGEFLPESKRHIPTPKVAFQKLFGNTKNYYTNALEPNEIGKANILVGAFMVLKRAVYDEVNGFDEDYFMYGEDIDLSYKIFKAGYKNYYFGKIAIIHFKGESTLKDKVYAQRFYGAMEIFYNKHFKNNSLMAVLVKLGLKLFTKRGRPVKKADIKPLGSTIISNQILKELKTKLVRPITFTKNLEEIASNTQVVFDSDDVDFKTMIHFMKTNEASNQNSYRILVKNSNFILGSDSNETKGEVIHF